jgi:electron transport complex protein RnfB
MFKRADKIGVVPCDCRRIYGRCGKPELTCFHLGRMVDYEVGRGSRMKRITAEEAIKIIDECEMAGLVHSAFNNAALPGVLCQCCSDCCSTLEPGIQSGRLMELTAPSRYQARVKEELCKGCRECLKRCPFGAIEMQSIAGSKKMKAFVNKEKCLGCGLCVVGCKQTAMNFLLVRPPEFIPPKPEMGRPMVYSVQ